MSCALLRQIWFWSFLTMLSLNCLFAEEATIIKPPVAKIVPKEITMHDDTWNDPYFWLREKANPEVIKYLEAENEYADAVLQPVAELREKLYQEILGRIKETDLSVPEKVDDYYYYTRTEQGQPYPIYCRKKGSLTAAEEILLDENLLAEGKKYLSVGMFKPSPDHRLLAYSVDTDGSESYTLYVKNLETGALFADVIVNTSYSLEWADDNQTFFYTILDYAKRPYKLYRHVLGSNPKDDVQIYSEKDEAFNVAIYKSKSRDYFFMSLDSSTTSEIYYLKVSTPTGAFTLVHPRQHEMEYSLDHHGDYFYIVTNDNARNFKVMKAPVADPKKHNWQEVIPVRSGIKVDGIDLFLNHFVVYERQNGLKQMRVVNLKTNEAHYIEFPEPVYTFRRGRNREFNAKLLRFQYTSLVTPASVFDYDMEAKTRELKKQYEVQGGYDASLYQSERIFAKASDNTMIPISLVYKKGIAKDGSSPLYLYGYGAYGISIEPNFSATRLSLLNRGFVYAIAHIRGGEEMGRIWYDQGKLLSKKNSFSDFIACAEHLITQKYTAKDKLVVYGGSAGGLLMGAVNNMRPDLFKAVIAEVPFVDMLNTMLDASLPLTVTEYEEWGNPNEKDYYQYMKSYSPYNNVKAQAYPNMLITAGLNDPRVGYWEAAKLTAKLRTLKTDNNLVLLKTNTGAGHSGSSGRYEEVKDIALEYAFILYVLGLHEKK